MVSRRTLAAPGKSLPGGERLGSSQEKCPGVWHEMGHSMLELLVCMGVVMLLMTAALPKGMNMDRMDVKYETMRLMNLIRYVQTWSHQWDYCTYEHNDNYGGKGQQRPTMHFYNLGNWYYARSGPWSKYYYEVGHGVKLSSNQRDYLFNARGQSTAGTIRISKNGYEERIVIDTVGRARVEEG